MPSYVITKNGPYVHIKGEAEDKTLCGRMVDHPATADEDTWRQCLRCLDRAAKMSKREE